MIKIWNVIAHFITIIQVGYIIRIITVSRDYTKI